MLVLSEVDKNENDTCLTCPRVYVLRAIKSALGDVAWKIGHHEMMGRRARAMGEGSLIAKQGHCEQPDQETLTEVQDTVGGHI